MLTPLHETSGKDKGLCRSCAATCKTWEPHLVEPYLHLSLSRYESARDIKSDLSTLRHFKQETARPRTGFRSRSWEQRRHPTTGFGPGRWKDRRLRLVPVISLFDFADPEAPAKPATHPRCSKRALSRFAAAAGITFRAGRIQLWLPRPVDQTGYLKAPRSNTCVDPREHDQNYLTMKKLEIQL